MNALPKTYLSPSQINTYLRCPAQYYFRYIKGLIIPPSASLTKGKAVHAGNEFNYKQKIESKTDLPVKEVLDYTAATFDELAKETDFQGTDKGKELDSTIKLTKLYHEEVAPTVQPVAVEEKVEINFDNTDYSLLGYIDLIDEKKVIHDTKTTGRTPNEDVIQNSLQLRGYALAYRTLNNEEENGIQLDYLVSTKTPKVVQFKTKVEQRELDRFLKIMGIVAHNIKCNNFYPNVTNQLCNEKACGYWNVCKGEW